jgi:hypothetical protein
VEEPDPELLSLPRPQKRDRTAAVILMSVTAVASLVMTVLLWGEASYAIQGAQPTDVGALSSLELGPAVHNRYVRATGTLGTAGAIKYGRTAEGDSFRLAPVLGAEKVWVEIRVPEGFEGPRFVPPSIFAGRLVPLRKAGIRHLGLEKSVEARTADAGAKVDIPTDAWLLVDGASPRTSRWAVALCALFGLFAGWNGFAVWRVLSRVRDRRRAPEAEPA